MAPSVTLAEAQRFDTIIMDQATSALGGDPRADPVLHRRSRLPVSKRGLGLRSAAATAAPAGPITFGPGTHELALLVNGKERKVTVETRTTLLDALRDGLDLTGAKKICDRGACGGCTVLMNGEPITSCLTLALDATMHIEGRGGRRAVKADDFYLGLYATALADDEILTAIRVPAFAAGTGWAYEKLKRKTGDWATAGAAVVMKMSGGTVSQVRIALTNLAPTAIRAHDAEKALLGQAVTPATLQAAADAAMAVCQPAADLRGDEEYKTAMAGQMVKRALAAAAARCA
jgi:CO/xanthine dehydrogenase FAD-binding subunit